MDISKGDFGLNINADVALWLDYRQFNNCPQLHQHHGFLIMNETSMEEFEEFKRDIPATLTLLKHNELMQLWISSSTTSSSNYPVTSRFGNEYVVLNSTQVGSLCQWVLDLREAVIKEGSKALTDLTSIAINVGHHQVNGHAYYRHFHHYIIVTMMQDTNVASSSTGNYTALSILLHAHTTMITASSTASAALSASGIVHIVHLILWHAQ